MLLLLFLMLLPLQSLGAQQLFSALNGDIALAPLVANSSSNGERVQSYIAKERGRCSIREVEENGAAPIRGGGPGGSWQGDRRVR